MIEVFSSSNGFEIGPDFYSFPPYLVHTLYLKEARKDREVKERKESETSFFSFAFLYYIFLSWSDNQSKKKKYHASLD